jgi:Zn-dependent peptidase ImmA (M78 family)
VQGFIKQIGNKVMLCLTIRGTYADRFWFTLFHEIGHIINGDLDVRFVDFDSVSSEMEEKANRFAADTLIPPDLFKKFVKSGLYDKWEYIEKCAKKAKVPPVIVLGRLRKEKLLDWSEFTEHNVQYEWADK